MNRIIEFALFASLMSLMFLVAVTPNESSDAPSFTWWEEKDGKTLRVEVETVNGREAVFVIDEDGNKYLVSLE